MPSHRGHMPPTRVNVRFSLRVSPFFSNVTAPAPLIVAVLNENALGEPMCGLPSRLKRIRNIALASVAVPTVERGLAPMRSWSTTMAVVNPSSTSTSGRVSVGMKPWTKELYVSLISRCDSAAIVPKTSELLPDPETPVNAVSRRFGISTSMSLRLFTRAPWTRIMSWESAVCSMPGDSPRLVRSVVGQCREALLGVLVPTHALDRVLPPALHVVERRLVSGVARGDGIPEVLVLGLDHLVGTLAPQLEVARSPELPARHRLHDAFTSLMRTVLPAGSRNAQSRMP